MSSRFLRWLRGRLASRFGRAALGALVVAAALLGWLYLHADLSGRGLVAGGDGHINYLAARSLVYDGDLDFANEARRFGAWKTYETETGRTAMPTSSLGLPVLLTPAVAGARAAGAVARVLGADVAEHGVTVFHQRIVYVLGPLCGLAAALFGFLLARRTAGRWASLVAALAVLAGTNLAYYASWQPGHSHVFEAASTGLFLWMWARSQGDLRWRRFALLGALLGIAGLVRVPLLALGVVVAIELAAAAAERPRAAAPLLLRGLVALGVALLVQAPALAANAIVYGSPLASANGPGYVDLTRPWVVELLYSSRNGWFATHPLAYLGALGLLITAWRRPLVGGALLAAAALLVYVNACVYDWWGVESFGARRLCALAPVLVVGLASLGSLLARLPGRLRAAAAAVGVAALAGCVAWNLLLLDAYGHGDVPRSQPRTMCCAGAPEPLARLARPVYEAAGNPGAWPVNWLFAARHGVEPARFDLVFGAYASRLRFPALLERGGDPSGHRQTWNLGGVHSAPFLRDGFGPHQSAGKRRYRWTVAEEASFFLPLYHDRPHRLRVRVRPSAPGPLEVRVGGRVVFADELAATWTTLAVELPDAALERGTNVVTLRAPLARYRGDDIRPPADDAPVGVAVGTAWIEVR